MLVLTVDESGKVYLENGQEVSTVVVLEAKHKRVKLGFSFPSSTRILRGKLYEEKHGSEHGNQTGTSMGVALPEMRQEACDYGHTSRTVRRGPTGNSGDGV